MESARDSFRHTRLQSSAFTMFAGLGNVSVDGGVEIFKRACLVGKADVFGIIELPPVCGWQIIDVYCRCLCIYLWQAIIQRPL